MQKQLISNGNGAESLPTITFVIHDFEGGVASMNYQILTNADFGKYFRVHIILWRAREEQGKTFGDRFPASFEVSRFVFSRFDNYYLALKRLHRLIDGRPGLLVTNDGMELESIGKFGTCSVVFSIVHDFYNLRLAIQNTGLIDYFICHTEVFTRALSSNHALKDRVGFLLHGVKTMKREKDRECNMHGKLRIVSIARLTAHKGVMQFRQIDDALIRQGVRSEWIIIGSGELKSELTEQWAGKTNIGFYEPDTADEVFRIASEGDVFISPSSFEGYGIALLEAMACGLVPVISRLPVGIYGDLADDVGFTVEERNPEAFAACIARLDKNRTLLCEMGKNARRLIAEKYNINETALNFMEYFRKNTVARVRKGRQPKRLSNFGLFDQPYIPNGLARLLKKVRH